ncbi:MAG: TRAP transporter small permease [Hyphomicrobiaceae bacterium]
MINLIDTASRWLARGSVAVSVAMFAATLLALTLQVVARYVFNAPPTWTEELSLALFTWIVLLMGSAGVREGFHVCLDIWPATLAAPAQAALHRLVQLITLAIGIVLLKSGWSYVADTQGQVSAAISYPIEALHSAAPVCGGLISIHAIAMLLQPSNRPPQP